MGMNNHADRDAIAQEKGFIDQYAGNEFYRMGVACFLVSLMNSNSTLLAVVFQRNGHNLHDVGVILSFYALPVVIMSVLAGKIGTRFGVLNTARTAMFLMIIGFMSFHLTRQSFYGALGSRMVQGIGQGMFLASIVTYAQGRLSPTRMLYLTGLFAAAVPMAQAVAPPLGGYVLNTYGDGYFFLAATLPAIFGLSLTFGLRPLNATKKEAGGSMFAALRRDKALPLFTMLVYGSLFGFVGSYLAVAMEAKAVPLAAFFTSSTASMFISRFALVKHLDAMDRQALLGSGITAMSIGFILVALSGQSWPIVLGGISFGLGYSVVYPVISLWMGEGFGPAGRAGPLALMNTSFNIGLYAAPYPITFVVAEWGYGVAMYILAALGIATATIFFVRFIISE